VAEACGRGAAQSQAGRRVLVQCPAFAFRRGVFPRESPITAAFGPVRSSCRAVVPGFARCGGAKRGRAFDAHSANAQASARAAVGGRQATCKWSRCAGSPCNARHMVRLGRRFVAFLLISGSLFFRLLQNSDPDVRSQTEFRSFMGSQVGYGVP
jgi:hypothetical protein